MLMISRDFIFDTFDEAMDVHKKLFERIRKYNRVTYAELLYLICNEDKNTFREEYCKYGWTNLLESKVEPVDNYINGNWVLRLPKVKLLKEKEND